MRNKIEKGVDLNLRQFIKSLGYIAGGTALLASTPWLSSCTPEKLKEIRNSFRDKHRLAGRQERRGHPLRFRTIPAYCFKRLPANIRWRNLKSVVQQKYVIAEFAAIMRDAFLRS